MTTTATKAVLEEPGQQLRKIRERLQLRYRDVEEASQKIAKRRKNEEFVIGLSRLADIENRGTVPSIYRAYTLCAIYRLDITVLLSWYGIDLQRLLSDSAAIALSHTHLIEASTPAVEPEWPLELTQAVDLKKTAYLSHLGQRWGKLPMAIARSLDVKHFKYGFVGADDWSMYPILAPGSFVQIDESKRRVVHDGWIDELDRPIYFIEHRSGYRCGWCTERDGKLILQPHSRSHVQPEIFVLPSEAEVLGQVVGVAMRLDLGRRRHTYSLGDRE